MEFATPPENILGIAISLGLLGSTARRVTSLGQVLIASSGTTTHDIWTGGGIYPWLTSETSLEAVSGSANDSSAGTGARTIIVNGLDANYREVAVPVVMNGTTAVALSRPLLRINSVIVATNGSLRRNDGVITIRDAGGGTARAYIPISSPAEQSPAMSKQSNYTVPAGYTLLIENVDIQINNSAGGGGSIRGTDAMLYFSGPSANTPIRLPRIISTTDMVSTSLDPRTPIPVAEKNDFLIRDIYTSANNMSISGSMEGWIFRRVRSD